MAVTVSKQFKQNFEIAAARWLAEGDTPEQVEEIRAAVRIELAEGDGFFRKGTEFAIADVDVRRKLWDDYFQAIANEVAAEERARSNRAKGINSRIVNSLLTSRKT